MRDKKEGPRIFFVKKEEGQRVFLLKQKEGPRVFFVKKRRGKEFFSSEKRSDQKVLINIFANQKFTPSKEVLAPLSF